MGGQEQAAWWRPGDGIGGPRERQGRGIASSTSQADSLAGWLHAPLPISTAKKCNQCVLKVIGCSAAYER